MKNKNAYAQRPEDDEQVKAVRERKAIFYGAVTGAFAFQEGANASAPSILYQPTLAVRHLKMASQFDSGGTVTNLFTGVSNDE